MTKVQSKIVEICVFRMAEKGPQFLLLKRASDDKLYPDLWQIITGTAKRSEKPLKAAVRELKEETGLLYKQFWVVPYIDSYYDMSKDTVQLLPVFAAEVDPGSDVKISSEHQTYGWLENIEAKKRLVWPGQKLVIDIVYDYIIGKKEAGRLLEIR